MNDKWISKIKGSKPFNVMIGITAILTALITFTDAIEKVSDKFEEWFGNQESIEEVITTSFTDESVTSKNEIVDSTSKVKVISPASNSGSSNGENTTPLRDGFDSTNAHVQPNPEQAFTNYNDKHITLITDFSDAISLSKNKLIMDLSVSSKALDSTIKPKIKYHINKQGSLYEINPTSSYLKSLAEGKLTTNNLSHFNLGLPVFDVKTVNNSEESVFITKAIFRVKKSIQDSTPYFKKSNSDTFKIPISNIGYGPAVNVKLKLSIKDSTGIAKMHEITIDTLISNCKTCDVSKILESYNVDVNLFKGDFSSYPTPEQQQQQRARGSFKGTYVPIDGVLTYQAKNINHILQNYSFNFTHNVKLEAKMHSVASLMSMVLPSNSYDQKLELNKENYTRTINISQVLAPKGFDRFQVKFFADATSRHLFDITIVYNDGQTLTFENLALNYFKPKL